MVTLGLTSDSAFTSCTTDHGANANPRYTGDGTTKVNRKAGDDTKFYHVITNVRSGTKWIGLRAHTDSGLDSAWKAKSIDVP